MMLSTNYNSSNPSCPLKFKKYPHEKPSRISSGKIGTIRVRMIGDSTYRVTESECIRGKYLDLLTPRITKNNAKKTHTVKDM